MSLKYLALSRAAVIGSLALALCAACGAARSDAPLPAQPARPAVEVEVQQVTHRQAGNLLRASGLVAFKNETTLAFNAPGQIETMLVDQGDQVAVGQVLATLRRTSVGADAAEAGMVRLTAQQNFDRISRLRASGAASQADLDNARLGLERAREIVRYEPFPGVGHMRAGRTSATSAIQWMEARFAGERAPNTCPPF